MDEGPSTSAPPQTRVNARNSNATVRKRPPTTSSVDRRLDGMLAMLGPILATLIADLPEPKRERARSVLKLFFDALEQTKSPMRKDSKEAGHYVYRMLELELSSRREGE